MEFRRVAGRIALPLVVGGLGVLASAKGLPPGPEIATVASDGTQSDGGSQLGTVSSNGRYVAFWTVASTFDSSDDNGNWDCYVHDRLTGETTLVSGDPDGNTSAGSHYPVIAANGKFVVFNSDAEDLVDGDTNGSRDVFLRDLKAGTTRRVSVAEDGTETDAYSQTYGAALSSSGRYLVYYSGASNLVAGDDNGNTDVFLTDLKTGVVTMISADADGNPGDGESDDPSISPNGRFVAFNSAANNLVGGSNDGSNQVLVWDRKTGEIRRASQDADGTPGDAASYDGVVSNNGRLVAFSSSASNLVTGDANENDDAFLKDMKTGEVRRVSVAADGGELGQGGSYPSFPPNGKSVVFHTSASLIETDMNGEDDIYLLDLRDGSVRLLTTNPSGDAGNGGSYCTAYSLSANGRWLAFYSAASDLVPGDENGQPDIFVRSLK
jgi:Tol biopolymer transport system component